MRLIDADALTDASCHGGVCAECDDMYGGNNVVTNCSEVRLRFLKLIKDAPTIEERKTGEWIPLCVRQGWICSKCRKENVYAFRSDDNGEYVLQDYFCPHCGADMRGGQDE